MLQDSGEEALELAVCCKLHSVAHPMILALGTESWIPAAGVMAQQLGVCSVLVEGPSLVPSNHTVNPQLPVTLAPRDSTPSLASMGTGLKHVHAHTHTQ